MIDVDIKNERVLKEFIDGDTIYELVLQDKMKSVYIDQLRSMCVLLYVAYTNIDYFPTNFVVQDGEIYYIDLSAMITWMNGTLSIGALNTGQKPLSSCNM